ncbi:MAG: NUDIX domain-containing protein [Erysipelotrichales bacterium]|nr:NUDIX domain-containing protein [Erysipelotrichales bacterium]
MMEIWDAYNDNLEKIGIDLIRGERIPEGMYHLAAEVIVKHIEGDYLLMTRDPSKEAYPGYETLGTCGAVLKGENGYEGALRELREESGIYATTLTPLNQYISKEQRRIYVSYYTEVDCDKDSITLQEGETVAYRWISLEEVLDFLKSDLCIPSQRLRLQAYFESIR